MVKKFDDWVLEFERIHSITDTNDSIYIYLNDGSSAELDRIEKVPDNLKSLLRGDNVFWFARLKAKKEGVGSGTVLMNELVKILDKRKISVINAVNPYGVMTMEDLLDFYKKFGFEEVEEGIMIRNPR